MASNKTLKGLTIEIGGDTTKLGKALESVNSKSRDLSSELGQINKLLKLDPGNTELLTQKQKVLASAIKNTAEKLDTLKEAEKQVQKQFERGEVTEDQVRALKREIIATERQMQGYEKAVKETTDEVKKLGKQTDNTEGKTKKLGNTAKAVASTIAAVAAVVAAAVTALSKATVQVAAYADDILTTSTVTGISTQKLQEYAYAAELVDVSVDTLTKSHAKNIKSMKAAQDGTKLAVDAYKALGVEVTNLDGSLRDGETVYWEVIDALGKMENETERDALAMQILGKSAQELNPLIEAGSEKMNELAQEAQGVGAVLSDETLGTLGAFDDTVQRLKGTAGAAANALGSVLLPELNSLATSGAELLAEFNKNLNATGGGLDGFIVTIDQMSGQITGKVNELLEGIVSKAAELLPALTTLSASLTTSAATAIVKQLPNLVQAVVDALLESIPAVIDGFVTLLTSTIEGVDRSIPIIVAAIPAVVMAIIDALLRAAPPLIDAALTLLMGVCDAIPLLIEYLSPLIPQIVVAIVTALIDALPQITKASLTLFFAIRDVIPSACAALLKAMPQIWNTIWGFMKQLPSKLVSVGKDLVSGLWQGMKERTTWLKNKIKGWVGDVTKFLKKLFGINSPSKVTAYMGEMLDEGLAAGIDDNAQAPKDAMSDLSSEVINAAGQVDGVAIERHVQNSYSLNAAATASQNAGLLVKLDKILAAIERGQILTIDGNVLVGATANTMNSALGQRRVLAGRGAV